MTDLETMTLAVGRIRTDGRGGVQLEGFNFGIERVELVDGDVRVRLAGTIHAAHWTPAVCLLGPRDPPGPVGCFYDAADDLTREVRIRWQRWPASPNPGPIRADAEELAAVFRVSLGDALGFPQPEAAQWPL